MLTPGAGAADFLGLFFPFFPLCGGLHTQFDTLLQALAVFQGDILGWDVVSERLDRNCSIKRSH